MIEHIHDQVCDYDGTQITFNGNWIDTLCYHAAEGHQVEEARCSRRASHTDAWRAHRARCERYQDWIIRKERVSAMFKRWLNSQNLPNPRYCPDEFAVVGANIAARIRVHGMYWTYEYGLYSRYLSRIEVGKSKFSAWVRAHHRDLTRFNSGEWVKPKWLANLPSLDIKKGSWPLHIHVSLEDPTKCAYYESEAKFLADRQTRINTGRLIRKFWPDLTEKDIKGLAEAQVRDFFCSELKVSDKAEDFIHAINDGPTESCQSSGYYSGGGKWYRGHVHPAAAYASGDIEVLWLEDGEGHPIARTLANKRTKECSRIYGDANKLLAVMGPRGYTQEVHALKGCRLLKIESQEGHGDIMPYVDAGIGSGGGSLYVYESDGYYILCEDSDYESELDTYCGYANKGLTEAGTQCSRCGEYHDEEDMESWYNDGRFICSDCQCGDVVRVEDGCDEYFIRTEDATPVHDSHGYVAFYTFTRTVDNRDDVAFVDIHEEYYRACDVTYVESRGEYVLDTEVSTDDYSGVLEYDDDLIAVTDDDGTHWMTLPRNEAVLRAQLIERGYLTPDEDEDEDSPEASNQDAQQQFGVAA